MNAIGRWCEFCDCAGPSLAEEANWPCPLLGGKNICDTCCHCELVGGMGASDSLEDATRRTGKTPQEIRAICEACPHGGPDLGLMGDPVCIAPGKEDLFRRWKASEEAKLAWLRGGKKDS